MKINYKLSKKNGFALLLTLMILVLLAGLIVEFQADTAIHVRASNYRADHLQCQYAAESALIIASQLTRDMLESKTPRTAKVPTPQDPDDPNLAEPDDLENLDDLTDPNDAADPNDLDEPNEMGNIATLAPFILVQKTVQIGTAVVDIEIHDENAKYPLYWLLHSPFEKEIAPVEDSIGRLGELLDAEPDETDNAINLAMDIDKRVEVLEPMIYLAKQRSPKNKNGEVRMLWRPRRARIKNSPPKSTPPVSSEDLQKQHYQAMGAFVQQWHNETANTKSEFPETDLTMRPENFTDYLGYWGHTKINVNTAPPEVMEAAFLPLGITQTAIQAIVEHRQQNPIDRRLNLYDISDEIDRDISRAVQVLAIPTSDTFSIHINARLGRANYNILTGTYRTYKGAFVNYAFFQGD